MFADADLEAAVDGTMVGRLLNQGQCCCAGSRLFVQDAIYDDFVERVAEKARARKLGNPFDSTTEQGPQVDQAQFDKIMRYIHQGRTEGAKLAAGGERWGTKGYFVQPTVFSHVRDDMRIATDEIFGPVLCALRFSDLEEVVARSNATEYGLAAAVWTRDISKAHAIAAQVRAGTVWVNCYDAFDAAAPFGGFKRSGIGRELGEKALENYTELKTVNIKL